MFKNRSKLYTEAELRQNFPFIMTSKEVYFDIPVEINSPHEKRIFQAFSIYDFDNHNMVDARDIAAIIRSLGCVPMEEEIQEIIRQTEFSHHPGEIHLSNFMPHLKMLLVQGKMKPSSAETLLKAFKVFDTKNKGFIIKEEFIEIMKSFGEEIKDEELEQMLKSAVDPLDNKVYYEIYIRQLIHEPKGSIYKLAQKYGITRRSEAQKLKLKKRMQ